jgi:hypothetical protein
MMKDGSDLFAKELWEDLQKIGRFFIGLAALSALLLAAGVGVVIYWAKFQ